MGESIDLLYRLTVVSNMHVSKKHVFSDTKHNTTKLPTVDECHYY